MAIHLATASDYLQRTTSLPSPGGNKTVMLWVRLRAPVVYQSFYGSVNDPIGTYDDYWQLWSDQSQDVKFAVRDGPAADNTVTGNALPATGQWFHVAAVQMGTGHQFYLNGILQGSATENMSGATFTHELLGGDSFGDGNLDIAYFREWSAALTDAEITTEMAATSAVRTANLFLDAPLPDTTDLTDHSGNGRNFTAVGSPLEVLGPLTSGNKQPRRWFFFAHNYVPVTEGALYRWGTRAISYNALAAFIDGRIPVDGWQEIVRAASSMTGEYNVDHGGLVANDADGFLRALLAEETTKWFLNRQGMFILLSDAAIVNSLLPPRILMCGPCTDVQLGDNRTATLQIEDVLSPYLDRLYPQYTIGDAYPFRFTETDAVTEDLNTEDPGLQVPRALRDQVIPIYYGPHVETRKDPLIGLVYQRRRCPLFFMGYTFLTAGTGEPGEIPPELAALMEQFGSAENWGGWGEVLLGLGELQVPNVAVSDLSEEPKPIILTEDRYGTDALFPGHANWPFSTNYVMRNGFKVTVGYLRGPVLWHHITGLCYATADTCGWPSFDPDTFEETDPIDQAGFGWQSFISEHVFANGGAGFTSGPQVGLTVFDPNIQFERAMVWTSKIQDWQTMTAERLGTVKGYIISMALTKPVTLREIDRTFNVTFDAFTAKNASGQIYKFSINDLASPLDGVPVREWIELTGLPAPQIDWPSVEEEIDFTYGTDPTSDGPLTITFTKRDDHWTADRLMGDVKKIQGVRNLAYTSDDKTARDAIGRRLILLRNPPLTQPLPLRTDGVDREIGEQILVTHQDGLGVPGSGYVDHPFVLMGASQLGDDVTLQALDLGPILRGVMMWAPDSLPEMAIDGTPEEQAQYWTWTEDDGTVPGGGLGSEWR